MASARSALEALCKSGEWNYAVYWRAKSGKKVYVILQSAFYRFATSSSHFLIAFRELACSVLTWEDSYCPQPIPAPGTFNQSVVEPQVLNLTIAKMSYHIYGLGER